MERRYLPLAAARVAVEKRVGTETPWIVGYGAVFFRDGDPGTEFQLWDDMVERIMPGAFDRALREKQDCRGLKNHNPDLLLGRCSSGTMRLSVDATGLKYEISTPDTTAGRDCVTEIQRGDLTGSSFSFMPSEVTWREFEGIVYREIRDCNIYDCGPVTFPAYTGTDVHVRLQAATREFEDLRRQYDQWKATQRNAGRDAVQAAARARLREMELDFLRG